MIRYKLSLFELLFLGIIYLYLFYCNIVGLELKDNFVISILIPLVIVYVVCERVDIVDFVKYRSNNNMTYLFKANKSIILNTIYFFLLLVVMIILVSFNIIDMKLIMILILNLFIIYLFIIFVTINIYIYLSKVFVYLIITSFILISIVIQSISYDYSAYMITSFSTLSLIKLGLIFLPCLLSLFIINKRSKYE